MTANELEDALARLDPRSATAAAALTETVRAESTRLPARAAELAAAADPAMRSRARSLAAQLGELAAIPLLDVPAAGAAADVWRLGTATAAAVHLRARVGEQLRALLADTRIVPPGPPDPRLEEPVRPRRVCDEAYGLLRELVNDGERRGQLAHEQWAFLRLLEAERDAEISRVQSGMPFARLMDDLEA